MTKQKILENWYKREIYTTPLPATRAKKCLLWLGILFAGLLFLAVFLLLLTEQEQVNIDKPTVDFIEYDFDCPPVLTKEECYRRVIFAIDNGFDIQGYLVSVYERVKK